jgi:hypothetical protein
MPKASDEAPPEDTAFGMLKDGVAWALSMGGGRGEGDGGSGGPVPALPADADAGGSAAASHTRATWRRALGAMYAAVRSFVRQVFEFWVAYVRTTTTLALVLLCAVSEYSVLRFVWLLIFLGAHMDTMQDHNRRQMWYTFASTFAALSAGAAAVWTAFNPAVPSATIGGRDAGGRDAPGLWYIHADGWPDFVGLHSGANTVSEAGLDHGWGDIAWPLLLLLILTLERSNVGWRIAARRRWDRVRYHLLPELVERNRKRTKQSRLRKLWRRFQAHYRGSGVASTWLSYGSLLLVGLVSPVNAIGATCLALLIALLFLEQSYTELSERAALQLPLWRTLEVLLVLTLGVRYAFRIPLVAKLLLQEGGLLGPSCDANYADGILNVPRTLTICTAILQDIGLAGGDAWIQLGASALLIALCANRVRACRRAAATEVRNRPPTPQWPPS